jgi:glucose-6-phosphate isomerase
VQSCIWGVNAFDQFGVELGKTIASRILPAVQGANVPLHPATAHLLGVIRTLAGTR